MKPVDVFADEPDSREVASMINLDHASLLWQARGTLRRHGVAGGHAAPHSSAAHTRLLLELEYNSRLELLLDGFEFRYRN